MAVFNRLYRAANCALRTLACSMSHAYQVKGDSIKPHCVRNIHHVHVAISWLGVLGKIKVEFVHKIIGNLKIDFFGLRVKSYMDIFMNGNKFLLGHLRLA